MAPAGSNNAQLQQRIAAAAAVGLGPNANWAQIREAQNAAARKAAQQKQVEDYNQKMAQRMQAMQAMQTPPPPAAQQIGEATATEEQRKRRMGSNRGSLLAGNTGGYNPATGRGRLGGMMRSLLG